MGVPLRASHGILTTSGVSADSGAQMLEARGYSKWVFHLGGTFTGYSVTIYGTSDPGTAGTIVQPGSGSNWFVLDAPSVQTGTGAVANPLTNASQSLEFSGPLLAVRAVATGTSQTGTVTVFADATP